MCLKNAVKEEQSRFPVKDQERIAHLRREISFWFQENHRLWAEDQFAEAEDAALIYINLSNELKEVLFG